MLSAWIVIPTFDEAANIAALVNAIWLAVQAVHGVQWSLLIVDDNSPDGTGRIADGLALANPAVHVLHRPVKRGLGAAYVAGFEYALAAGAERVLQMDADFSHDPADLPRLLAPTREHADVAIGSRYVQGGSVEGWSAHRRLISRAGGWYARSVLDSRISDLTGGFKCFRADALREIDPGSLSVDGFAFQVETTFRAQALGLEVVEVPIAFHERRAGRSKMSAAIAVEALWRLPVLRLTHGR
jgi:dolichol-phosphate mannosyltransferase